MKKLLLPLTIFALGSLPLLALDHEHKDFTEILAKHTTPSGVRYSQLKKDKKELKSYLQDLSKVTLEDFNTWDKNDQISFFLNLYNAATLDLVLKHYPIKSFKDEVGGEKGPWKLPAVKTFQRTFTLDQIEHEYLRKLYNEPRIHFALNCASAGCPPLRSVAFTGTKLEEQLEEQTKAFLSGKHNKLSGKSLTLSPLFDWFKEDFVKKSGSVEAFVNPYFPQKKISRGKVKISYSEYGWSLNDLK